MFIRVILLISLVSVVNFSWGNPSEKHSQKAKTTEKSLKHNDDGRRTEHSFGLDFGLNNYLQDGAFPDANGAPYSVKPWGSWYVAITSTHVSNILGPLHLNWGADVSWYNFKFEDASIRVISTDDGIMYEDAQNTLPDIEPIKSKLTVAYLDAFMVPTLQFGRRNYHGGSWDVAAPFDNDNGRGLRIGMGGYIGYKLDDYVKFVYEEAGERIKDHDKDNYYVNSWRYGLRLQLGFNDIDFFANYDLSELFVENRGPALNAFSFGLSFY